MAEGFALADAFVRIRPDSGGFRAEATSQIKSALSGVTGTVRVGANTDPAKVALAALNPYMKAALRSQNVEIGADTKAAQAEIAAFTAEIAALARRVYAARLTVDDAGTQAKLGALNLQLNTLQSKLTDVHLGEVGIERIQTQLLGITAAMDKINSTISTAHINVDDSTAEARLAALTVNLDQLVAKARQVRVGLTDAGDLAAVNELIAAMGRVRNTVATIDFKAINLDTLTQSEADLKTLDKTLGQEFPAAVTRAGFAWRGWATLTQRVPLFGGIGPLLAAIGVWHILADAIIEVAAVLIPAGIAFAAFAIAASGAAQTVVAHLKAVGTVMDATGQAVRPFSNAFSQLQDAVTPHVYELFGEVMTVVNSRMGDFAALAQRATQVMDYFGARIAAAIASSGFQKFLGNAISDLTTVGDIIGNVFGIIGNLIRMVAGVAQVLFRALLDITGAVERLTSLGIVQFLGRWALGFHGAYIWIGLTATALLGMIPLLARLTGGISAATAEASGFDRIRLAATDLAQNTGILGVRVSNLLPTIRAWGARMIAAGGAAENAGRGAKILALASGALVSIPVWGWAAAGAVALGALTIYLLSTTSATQRWLASLQATIEKTATWTNVLTVAATGLAKVDAAQQSLATITGNVAKSIQFQNGAVARTGAVAQAANTQYREMAAGQQQLAAQANQVGFRLGDMARRFGGLTNAMGLAKVAGIKVTDVFTAQGSAWALDLRQIQALVTGYRYMGVAAGALGNDVIALQVAADDQITAVNQLNQAWSQLLGIVSGGESTFVTFAQDMLSANKALAQTGGTTRTVVATFASTATGTAAATARTAAAARAAATSFNGLNAQSLQLRSTWLQSISAAQSYYAALQTQAAAASLGAKGSALLTRAGGDLIRILAPAARGSATLRASIFLLAQQFGFSRSQMDQFVRQGGNVKTLERDLERINGQLARSVSNVGTDWAKMATVLQGQVKSALEAVALGQSGVRAEAQKLYVALHNNNFGQAKTDYNGLVTALHNSGLTWQQAKDYADAYTKGLHFNIAQILASAGPLNTLQADTSRQKTLYQAVKVALDTYNTTLDKNKNTISGGNAARAQLITQIEQAGIKAHLTSGQIDTLIQKILGLNKTQLHLLMTGTGNFSIQQIGSLSKPGGKLAGPSAMGGRVLGTGNRDSVPAMLMPGEVVVPTHMVRAGAVDHLRGRLPGFASGGFVGKGGFSGDMLSGTKWLSGVPDTFKADMIHSMESAMRSAMTAAINAARQALMSFIPGGSKFGGSSAALAFGRANLPPGWSWSALFNLWMGESGWNPWAVNPSSGAYGIPQSLGHGHPYALGDYANQIRWGIAYIRSRYGTSQAAYGAWLSRSPHWYDTPGKYLPPGLSLAMNGTGRPERVLTPGESAGGVNVYITVQPGAVMTGNALQIGTALGQFLLEYTKRGGKLYPQGVVAR